MHRTNKYLLNPQHRVTIGLIGCGGTGSQVLNGLGRINHALVQLGHPGLLVTVYDGDIVTDSNVGRQLYAPSDVLQNKAVLSVTRLNRFYQLDWLAVPSNYKNGEQLHNIIITCVDTAKARIQIGNYITSIKRSKGEPYENAYYWMDFGNTAKGGQVILGALKANEREKLPVITDIYDLSKVKDKDSGPSCSLAQALNKQDLFINSTLAQFGLNLLWKLFREAGIKHRGCYVNLDSMTVNAIPV